MKIDENISEELTLEMSLEEMALEVIDMLGVALYFAGAKKKHIDELIELYSEQMDKFYAKLPEDANYGQEEMISIIKSLKKDYPQFFIKA
ncbi:hypothetical protein OQH61_01335 [Helicobacter sp. MIT 21-1697]|uniref:hypothetical protein n=1 Tax=Helicobacter sp. MIT 21-1697 TaxID=2993733 RepID=UPI00224B8049|nr:hypothetical protein [Helicobacter sp. MIT 21-1697]MCX2716382.1 hypothetical protein [Helicobacter sp. MIT 21-1697]